MQKGLMQFTGSLEDTDDTISSMKDQVLIYPTTLNGLKFII